MPIETKELKSGLAFIQDGKRVATPKSDNYAVRPVAGGPFVKANGQEVIKDLREQFPGCRFLWLAKPFEQEAEKSGKKADKPSASKADKPEATEPNPET
jgi:hypothetical protein